MSEFRPGRQSVSQYAWMAPAIVLLALALVYLFGNDDAERSSPVQTLEESERYERVRIEHPDRDRELQPSAALSSTVRQKLLQNLSEFRAKHRVVGPRITVTAQTTSPESIQLAETIGGLLAQYNLGNYVAQPEPAINDASGGDDSMRLHVASRDVAFARDLLATLSPMLSGTVMIWFDDSLSTGKLQLVIAATPRFTGQGVAVF